MGRTSSAHVRGEKRLQKFSKKKKGYGKENTRGTRRSSDNIIKMDVKDTRYEKMAWIQLT
jgi:hypothetical protein